MLYNKQELPHVMQTAGKITILTALAGVLVFVVAFIFDAGTQQLSKVSAQTATTTLTVLNTPPEFVVGAYEVIESSTSSPTNSGDLIRWSAVGSDSNGSPYFLLVCDTNATPTANAASGPGNLGSAPPACSSTSTVQWGVSASTTSGAPATVTRVTTEIAPFNEVNNWYAWVCDDDPVNPRCNNVPVQGLNATNSSPFHVNRRPVLTDFYNNGPVDPGGTLTFLSTSTDPDVTGGEDLIKLVVCGIDNYSTTTNTCASDFLASTTIGVIQDATAQYILASIVRDTGYAAFGFLVDEHGHEATANPISEPFTVNNVAPDVPGGTISLNGGANITLTVEAGETGPFPLSFTARDANSCVNTTNVPLSEIVDYRVSVFRSDVGTSTCTGLAGSYNPNNCYPSGVGTTTWNLNCVASSTSCTGPSDDTIIVNCTFPLWFIADPTDVGTPVAYEATNWSAGISAIDDDGLVGAMSTTSSPVELISFTALDLLTAQIPFGSLEPGNNSGTLTATTTIVATGNTGLDQDVNGESMCGTFSVATECVTSATSTIPESEQRFSTTTNSYSNPLNLILSSTTVQELELNVKKTIGTTTASLERGVTYWGIAVPASISLAGSYQGLNTFMAVKAEPSDW